MNDGPRYVDDLPDLIQADEYDDYPDGNLVRLRVSFTENGLEILGDGMRPEALEALLRRIGSGPIDQMLCG
ncbi:radical SAM-modified peptide, FtsH ternary system-associated [Actinoplanes sp. CA-015351]|uniref:radical SAM-modified peptide, FtsH ternary system-associated n=1 Tax=Actinoplanes sp. CA-015351 TaxID=3239897 RepID=UPI003D95ECB2